VVGHDTGYIIGCALAADHRDRVDRLAVAEIPGAILADPRVEDAGGPPRLHRHRRVDPAHGVGGAVAVGVVLQLKLGGLVPGLLLGQVLAQSTYFGAAVLPWAGGCGMRGWPLARTGSCTQSVVRTR